MQCISSNTKQPKTKIKIEPKRAKNVLTAYTKYPDVEFNIDEFECYALSRLKVLRWIETQTGVGKSVSDSLHAVLKKNNLHIPLYDQISHFIGRLCFCQTTERRRWFLNTEKILFEARYKAANEEQKRRIHNKLCGNSASYETFSKPQIINNEHLNGKTPIPTFKNEVTLNNESDIFPYYKVPFSEVLTLIGRRNVYLLDGYAYVPNNRFFNIITGKFRAHLNRGLVSAQKAINKMKCDPNSLDCISRINHIIDGLYQITNGPQYKINKNKNTQILAKNINKLSIKHYPLCMQSSIEHLQMDGHLKHGGRMHLGLFLKGIGVSLQESLSYWRNSFKKIGSDKFNKQYAYNVRHNYGKEGKRVDYTPYSCNKIIGCAPNNGDYHGCPFKIFDNNNLKQYMLSNFGWTISEKECDTIIKLKNDNHYQLCCKHYFAIQHKEILTKNWMKVDDVISQWSHPNEYFDNSQELYRGENGLPSWTQNKKVISYHFSVDKIKPQYE
eukprot:30924_1